MTLAAAAPAPLGAPPAPAVRMAAVTVGYDARPILDGANLTLGWGQLVGVIGPNGAGKSTLLKTLLGTLPPRQGTVAIGGWPARTRGARNTIGYVPQREVVNWDFPVTVADVVMMGRTTRLGPLRFPGAADRQAVAAALAEVGMTAFAERQISQLSGGQQQRVFLARALAQGGRLLLLDEPLNGVDATTQDEIGALLRRHCAQGGTVLLATHDLELAAAWCTLIVLVNHAIVACGPPEAVLQPEILRATYGGHVLVMAPADLAGTPTMIPDDHGHPGGRPPPGTATGALRGSR
ncbi:MAG TPA: metal ABC transporter ATP-binding protein [Chloroflexia bacterium]|nr:metal ABC transporter ATP-binding protein [Chloroflexia bacterium]